MKTPEEFLDWLYHIPAPEGGWTMMAGALLFRAGLAPVAVSIRELLRNVDHLNPNRSEAPSMAIHFYRIEPYDNAVVDLYGGGNRGIGVVDGGSWYGQGVDYLPLDALNGDYLGWTTSDVLLATGDPVGHGG